MSVSRNFRGQRAVMVLALDIPPPPALLEQLRSLEGIYRVRSVDLNGS